LAAAEEIGGASLGDRVLSSRNLHRGADAIGNYIDVEAEIKDLKNERLSIIKTIEQLPAMEYDVIYKTYVDCFSLKEIAYDQKCSIDTVRRNKLRGLNHVQAILDQSGM
jgi:DNA-directed RNA polymerase specialized sigma24 family protein